MHPTNRVLNGLSPASLWKVMLGLVLGELAATGVGAAQEPAVPPAASPQITAPSQVPARQPAVPAAAADTAPPAGATVAAEPTSGSSTARGTQLIIAIGATKRLQMRDKKVIATVINQRDNVAVVQPVPNEPTVIQLNGKEAGTTRITLVAADKTEELYDVTVQLDVEYLRGILHRAVPTASLELIPAAGGTLIIGGTVTRSEDIDVVLRTALSFLGSDERRAPGGAMDDRIINAMRVGGVMAVQLDVCIARVNRSELRNLGFEFIFQGQHLSLISALNPGAIAGLGGVGGGGGQDTAIGTSANVVFNIFNSDSFIGFLQALRTENVSKLLAEPRLVTLSGRSATIVSGGDQAVPTIAGSGAAAVSGVRFEPFGTRISFLPIVLGDGKIYLEMEPEVSIPVNDPILAAPVTGTSNLSFGRTTQRVRTTAVMEDGQTLALGGLIQHSVNGSARKIPVLGDIPFFGVAFSAKTYVEAEEELLILVTPHLVDPMACDQRPTVLPGQETRSPDDFELFLEGILEAPRGQRDIRLGHGYQPAYRSGPTAGTYPCYGQGCGQTAAAPAAGCASAVTTVAPPSAPPAAPVAAPAVKQVTVTPAPADTMGDLLPPVDDDTATEAPTLDEPPAKEVPSPDAAPDGRGNDKP